jgi:hypothetical protein
MRRTSAGADAAFVADIAAVAPAAVATVGTVVVADAAADALEAGLLPAAIRAIAPTAKA